MNNNVETIGEIAGVTIGVSHPTVPAAKKVTQDDVWGVWTEAGVRPMKLLSRGMVVAQGYGKRDTEYTAWKKQVQVSDVCPVWGDTLPVKSVTVICNKDQQDEVTYWLEYVHGGGSVEKIQSLKNNRVAIRSNYLCW